jgi:phage-related protein
VDAVYVLHAFAKKTQKTTARDVEIGRQRLALLRTLRESHGEN